MQFDGTFYPEAPVQGTVRGAVFLGNGSVQIDPPRLLKETGLNPDARVAISILNGESPGVFLAEFDKGKLGRFTAVVDYQGRIPSAFGLNAGEQGMVFAHHGVASGARPTATTITGTVG